VVRKVSLEAKSSPIQTLSLASVCEGETPTLVGGLHCHKSLATVLSRLYILPDWSAQRRRSLQRYMLALVTEINIAMYTGILSSEKWLALCDPVHAVCVDRQFSCVGALHNLPSPAKGLVPETITQAPLVDFTDAELQSFFSI